MVKKIITKKKQDEKPSEDLLAVAKGAASPTSLGFQENYWVDKTTTTKDFIHFRREVRRGIYKIIKYMNLNNNDYWKNDPKLSQLHDIINEQLKPNAGLTWGTFANKWDVHPKQATKVIIKEHWIKEGGGFDIELGYHYPHAFTKGD